ncbi:putative plastid-lipid-associated protein 12, chloroplastic, partial [Capsicum baccatum]
MVKYLHVLILVSVLQDMTISDKCCGGGVSAIGGDLGDGGVAARGENLGGAGSDFFSSGGDFGNVGIAARGIRNNQRWKTNSFQFDRETFSFKFLPFKVPYPVIFRLLGEEAKGWLDTIYLFPSENLHISRGNKGTTFVLQRETEPRQKLLLSISTGTRVEE